VEAVTIRKCAVCPKEGAFPNSEWRGIKKGTRIICKSCYYREYRENNRDKIYENQTAWTNANRDKCRESVRKYENSEKGIATHAALVARDPVGFSKKAVERVNKMKEKHPEKYFAYQAAYQRIRKALLSHPINTKYLAELADVYRDCPEGLEVDHIIPLKNKRICGLHVPWNTQYLDRVSNARKSNFFDGTYNNESWKNEE